MKRKPLLKLILLVMVVVALYAGVSKKIEQMARKNREAQYESTFRTVQAELPIRTHRADVDAYLRAHGFDFHQQWGPGSVALDDFMRLKGREAAGFPCSYLHPSILIRFVTDPPHPPIPPARPTDEVTRIEFSEQSMDCL